MAKKSTAVKVQGLTKSFRIPLESSSGLKQKVINLVKGRSGYREFTPLRDISFEIEEGDFFGIVGRNGSGKSTLLKTIAGIYVPNSGAVHVVGTLVPFIELGVGFNPELTGRENVFLNGALLGFSRREMEAMYEEIVEFAEIRDFMEEKLKNYSSGMQVRLAFSIAIKAEGDVLLLDEVLAVGDEAFQKKCFEYFGHLKKMKKTVVLVTHDMNAVQRFCNKAMLIHDGEIKRVGKVGEIASEYSRLNLQDLSGSGKQHLKENSTAKKSITSGTGGVDLTFKIFNSNNIESEGFEPGENIVVKVIINSKEDLVDPRVGIAIQDPSGLNLFATNTLVEGIDVPEIKNGDSLEVDFTFENIFTDGVYTVSGAVASNYDETLYRRVEIARTFTTGGWSMKHALVHPRCSIDFKNIS